MGRPLCPTPAPLSVSEGQRHQEVIRPSCLSVVCIAVRSTESENPARHSKKNFPRILILTLTLNPMRTLVSIIVDRKGNLD